MRWFKHEHIRHDLNHYSTVERMKRAIDVEKATIKKRRRKAARKRLRNYHANIAARRNDQTPPHVARHRYAIAVRKAVTHLILIVRFCRRRRPA